MSAHVAMVRGVFVVGTGRCASTLMSRLVRVNSQWLSLSEWFTVLGGGAAVENRACSSHDFWKLLNVPHEDLSELLRSKVTIPELDEHSTSRVERGCSPVGLVPLPHLSDEPVELLEKLRGSVVAAESASLPRHHQRAFEFLCSELGRRLWVERSGGSLEYVSELACGFPDAKFVHLWREGPECALSMARHPYFRIRVARSIAAARALPLMEQLSHEVPLRRFAEYWSAVVLRGLRVLRTLPRDRVLHIGMGHLLEDPRGALTRIGAFIDPAVSNDSWVERAASLVRPVPSRHEMSDEDRAMLVRTCRVAMRELRDTCQ